MGELASEKCIIRKRAMRCILPRKHPRDGNRPFLPDLVICEIQVGQGGAEKTVVQQAAARKSLVLSSCASDEGAACAIRKRALTLAMLRRWPSHPRRQCCC